jgi:nucleotide-binding universal stress UspA family protein
MAYCNIMVRLNPAADNDALLRLTAELAVQSGARVIGIAAIAPFPTTYIENLAAVTAQMVQEVQDRAVHDMQACEAQFRGAMEGRVKKVEWRSTLCAGSPLAFFAKEARAADLIVTGSDALVNLGELAMRAGRPVLIVPKGLPSLHIRRAVIAWKDEREARRAVVDALPLLEKAQNCTILEITSLDGVGPCRQRLEDVAAWLGSHGIGSDVQPVGVGGSHSLSLPGELRRLVPDLVVAGAYGHNRMAEWAFGGVTQDILLQAEYCVLISH